MLARNPVTQPGYFGIALQGDATERSLAAVVAAIHFGVMIQKELGGFQITVVAREHEEGVAFGIGQIDGQSVVEHPGEGFGSAVPGEVERDFLQLGVARFFSLGGDDFHF